MNIRSLQRLDQAHPDLKRLMLEAAKRCPVDFEISEVRRSKQRQQQLVDAGASQTLRSRHLTGHAADIYCTVDGKLRWDWPLYARAAVHIKSVAASLGIKIVWGGDWRTLRDGPHYELDRRAYP